MIQVPSGRMLDADDVYLLRGMARYGFVAYRDEPVTLKSRIPSHVYVHGREDLTDNPLFEWEVGRKIAHIAWSHHPPGDDRHPCLIGIPTAGTALAQAAAMVDLGDNIGWYNRRARVGICHRTMREGKKEHGVHRQWVNGRPDISKHLYWLVDNVATDGQSKIEAAEKLEADGYPAKEMPCLIFVDRQQGAVERLKREGFQNVIVGYNLLDLTFAFGEMRLWPKEAVKAVEEEIRAHQLLQA